MKYHIYATTQNPTPPADQGDREEADEDHKGSGHQEGTGA